MAQWIENLYECDYSSYNHSKIRKFPEESDIVSLIGVRSESIDVFILLKEGKFDNIPEDTLFIQTNDFKRLVLSDRYNDVFYKGNINSNKASENLDNSLKTYKDDAKIYKDYAKLKRNKK